MHEQVHRSTLRNIARLKRFSALGATLVALGCQGELTPTETIAQVEAFVQPSPNIDPRRSLAITDQPILANFTLQRVFDQLVSTSGLTGMSSLALFQQWWDTQNPSPGLGQGPHCDDVIAGGQSTLNGYPYTCRATPSEGGHASCNPFSDPNSACAYIPVGLFMRFDLAPESGKHCGEYRIVFAKASGRTSTSDRNLLIFEAALRNPHYNQGIRGCEKIVRAFAELSNESSLNVRRTKLEQFYFNGYQEFDPIVHFSNFGDNAYGVGQVRTNQFVQPSSPRIWSLREYKLKTICVGAACSGRFVPVTNKVNPFGPLFDANSPWATAAGFRNDFLTQVPRLAATSLDGIGMNNSDSFNTGQSQANGTTESNYVTNFGTGPNAFRSAIQSALDAIPSALTPDDVVARAQAMSCAGCHRLSNNQNLGGGLTWPASLGFSHVSERDVDLEVVGGVTRYQISPALIANFLPHRKQLAEDFLNNVPRPAHPPDDPIGGRWTD